MTRKKINGMMFHLSFQKFKPYSEANVIVI